MKYFLFDIGHVLVDFDYQQFLDAVSTATGRRYDALTGRDLEMHDAVETGEISDEQWVEHLNRSMGISWTLGELTTLWSEIFTANHEGRAMFENAKRSTVSVCLLSNIARHHIDSIERNWPGLFDGVFQCFYSYRIGVRKPHPYIYQYALNELGVEGSQCFFVDDLPENIEAARSFGINAHQFVPENYGAIQASAGDFFDW